MKTKHTPGPWEYDQSDNIVYGQNGTTVCSVHLKPKVVGIDNLEVSGRSIGTLANANLIASAPELLEALEKLTSYCKAIGGQFDHCAELKTAIAIIKKAKGE